MRTAGLSMSECLEVIRELRALGANAVRVGEIAVSFDPLVPTAPDVSWPSAISDEAQALFDSADE